MEKNYTPQNLKYCCGVTEIGKAVSISRNLILKSKDVFQITIIVLRIHVIIVANPGDT